MGNPTDKELEQQGWEKRFSVEEHRAAETASPGVIDNILQPLSRGYRQWLYGQAYMTLY